MAGRGRLLLEPGFVHDEVDLPTSPVAGRNIEWPLPRTYQSYPSDDFHTSPSTSNDPEPEPGTSTTSTSPVDQQTRGVKRPSTARFPEVKYNRVVLSPLPKHLRPGNHYDNSSSSENDDEPTMRFVPATNECPELALAIMTAQAKFINKMEILQRAFYKELEEINDHFAEDHY